MSPQGTTARPVTRVRGQRKVRLGIVISNKMQKTIVVRVTQLVQHPVYQRVIHQTNSFKAHDETNRASIGDWVKIMETRPLSKEKRWRLIEIVRKASSAPPVPGIETARPGDSKRRAGEEAKEPPAA